MISDSDPGETDQWLGSNDILMGNKWGFLQTDFSGFSVSSMSHEKQANCCFIKAVYKSSYCSARPSLGGILQRVEVLCSFVPGCAHGCQD